MLWCTPHSSSRHSSAAKLLPPPAAGGGGAASRNVGSSFKNCKGRPARSSLSCMMSAFMSSSSSSTAPVGCSPVCPPKRSRAAVTRPSIDSRARRLLPSPVLPSPVLRAAAAAAAAAATASSAPVALPAAAAAASASSSSSSPAAPLKRSCSPRKRAASGQSNAS